MNAGFFDSSILIDCLRGRAEAISFVTAQSTAARPRTHLLVAAELLTGARDKSELALIDSFLQTFDLLIPNEADGLSALDLYRQFRLSHGVDWPDCQITATALRLGVEVFTQNVKHFTAFPGYASSARIDGTRRRQCVSPRVTPLLPPPAGPSSWGKSKGSGLPIP
jgi:predicted nucleic acid-binding protein